MDVLELSYLCVNFINYLLTWIIYIYISSFFVCFSLFKGCNLDKEIIEEGVPLIMLQIYVNPSLILFIRSSIIVTVLNCLTKENGITTIGNIHYMIYIFDDLKCHVSILNS